MPVAARPVTSAPFADRWNLGGARSRGETDLALQVVSKRVANAKSERFYRAGLGKKKEPGFFQVRRHRLRPSPQSTTASRRASPTHVLPTCACRASASSWRHTPLWLH